MAEETSLRVNGETRSVQSSPDTPLLYVLSDELGLKGPRFGCGLAQCGACSVLADGVEIRSCVTPLAEAHGRDLTTLEGLPARHAERAGLAVVPALSPLQEAMVAEQAIQCGYCYNGILIKATELLERKPQPSEAEIRETLDGHLCRCGTYPKIIAAIQRAAAAQEEPA